MEKNHNQRRINHQQYQGIERRRFKRINVLHFSEPIDIVIPEKNISTPGILMDISPDGAGILSFEKLELNTTFYLTINLNKIKTGTIKAKVIWVKQLGSIFRIGLQFLNISSEDFFKIYSFIEKFKLEDF